MKLQYRLKKDDDFKKVLSKKTRVSNKNFIIYYLPNEVGHVRVGISTSKKIGNAVVRNKTRRQIKTLLRKMLNYLSGYDLVIIVKKEYLEDDFHINGENLFQLLKKIGGLNVKEIKQTT